MIKWSTLLVPGREEETCTEADITEEESENGLLVKRNM